MRLRRSRCSPARGRSRSRCRDERTSDPRSSRGCYVPAAVTERSEVKGIWFATARRYMLEARGRDALAAVIEDIPPEHRRALAAPLPSQWYPEETLQESL